MRSCRGVFHCRILSSTAFDETHLPGYWPSHNPHSVLAERKNRASHATTAELATASGRPYEMSSDYHSWQLRNLNHMTC